MYKVIIKSPPFVSNASSLKIEGQVHVKLSLSYYLQIQNMLTINNTVKCTQKD